MATLKTKTRILFIDHDTEILEGYTNALSSRSSQWDIECHSDIPTALDTIHARSPAIVISSFHLGIESGVEFLKQVETIDSDIQRFIAATEDDKEQIESAIGSAYHFLPKPCPSDILITEIQRCLAIDNWLGNHRVKEVVAKMGEFPSLPPMYLKVVNALNNRSSSAAQIGHAISGDLAITAKVLQTVNSSFFGLEEKTSDISQAVGILGVESVKNLVLAIQVFGNMAHSPDQKAITDQLWHHSMSVAVAAKRIMQYETDDAKQAEEAYTAGLMHDIGKLVLINSVPDEYMAARTLSRENNIPLWQAENEVIGCNHAQTGAYLLARWGMPAAVVESVALHHEPVNTFGTAFSCLSAVHVSNALIWERSTGDEPHPDAVPSESFLAEIGKAGSWEEWQEVVTGKRTEKPKKKTGLSLQGSSFSEPENNTEIATDTTSSPIKNKRSTPSNQTEAENSSSGKLATIGVLCAACLGVVAGIHYLSGIETSDTPEPIRQTAKATTEQPRELKSSFAKAIEQAKQTAESGTSWSKELDEVMETTKEPEATKPVKIVQPVEVVETKPATKPAPVNTLPKPKLPSQKEFFPNITLSGIFYNASNSRASVNGKIRNQGDTVAGAKIERIERTRIIVRYEGTLKAIKLN